VISLFVGISFRIKKDDVDVTPSDSIKVALDHTKILKLVSEIGT